MNTNDDYLSSRPPLRKKSIKKTPKNNNYRHSLWVLAAACSTARSRPPDMQCGSRGSQEKRSGATKSRSTEHSARRWEGRRGKERRLTSSYPYRGRRILVTPLTSAVTHAQRTHEHTQTTQAVQARGPRYHTEKNNNNTQSVGQPTPQLKTQQQQNYFETF